MKIIKLLSKKVRGPITALLIGVASVGAFSDKGVAAQMEPDLQNPTHQVETILNSEALSRYSEKIEFLNKFLASQEVEDIEKAKFILEKNLPKILEKFNKNPELYKDYVEELYSRLISIISQREGADIEVTGDNIDPIIMEILKKNINIDSVGELNSGTNNYNESAINFFWYY